MKSNIAKLSNTHVLLTYSKVAFYCSAGITMYILVITFGFSKVILIKEKNILALSFCLIMIFSSINFIRYTLKERSIYMSENYKKYIFLKILYYLISTIFFFFAMHSNSFILPS